jgi:hypothetical protein
MLRWHQKKKKRKEKKKKKTPAQVPASYGDKGAALLRLAARDRPPLGLGSPFAARLRAREGDGNVRGNVPASPAAAVWIVAPSPRAPPVIASRGGGPRLGKPFANVPCIDSVAMMMMMMMMRYLNLNL